MITMIYIYIHYNIYYNLQYLLITHQSPASWILVRPALTSPCSRLLSTSTRGAWGKARRRAATSPRNDRRGSGGETGISNIPWL